VTEDAKATKVNYGATFKKFEPPPEKKGGWGWAKYIDYFKSLYKNIVIQT